MKWIYTLFTMGIVLYQVIYVYLTNVYLYIINRVIARDADYSAINRQIRYWLDFKDSSLTGTFMVEEFTGVIRLLRELNTDHPDGILNYTLRVSM